MKQFFYLLIIIFMILFQINLLYSNGLEEAILKAKNDLIDIRNKNSDLIDNISKERNDLLENFDELQTTITNKKNILSNLQKESKNIQNIINQKERSHSDKVAEKNRFTNIFKENTHNLHTLLQLSLVSGQYKNELNELRSYISQNRKPDNDYFSFINNLVLKELNRSQTIERFNDTIYKTDGSGKKADILRLGKIGAVFKTTDNNFGFLTYFPASNFFTEIDMSLNRHIKRNIQKSFFDYSEKKDILPIPVDITRGNALQQVKTTKSLTEQIQSGGLIVYPIIAIALFSIIIVIERIIILSRLHTKSDKLMPELIKTIQSDEWENAENVCFRLPGAASRVCLTCLKHKDLDKRVIEDVLQEAIMKELPVLERFLPTLKIFAAIAPLLGLLGTVTGMIGTFDVISIFGTGDPRLMSGGISEALITTKFGLIVAVPILLFHNFLSGRVSHIVNDMEKNAVSLINLLEIRKEKKDDNK